VWRHAVEACAKPLLSKRWSQDPHGTVVDYWLNTVRLAAADSLAAETLGRFETFFAQVAADTVPPHVVILLVASPAMLEERIAKRERQSVGSAVIGGRPRTSAGAATSIRHSGMAMYAAADDPVDRLLRLQQRIAAELRSPESNAAGGPRAVVTIAAGGFAQVVQEAVAVVEAMV